MRTQHFTVVPGNVEQLADYISPDVIILEKSIHFISSKDYEVFLRVPIETPDSAIVISLGVDNHFLNKFGLWLKIGVYDESGNIDESDNLNTFFIVDATRYEYLPPCYPYETIAGDHPRVSKGTEVPATFKFTLLPWQRLGFCETAQLGGYINFGKLRYQLNPGKPMYLEISNVYAHEENSIYYISINSI